MRSEQWKAKKQERIAIDKGCCMCGRPLDKIKSDTVWNKTKETIKSKGIPLVLDAVKEISSAIVTSMVKAAIQGV